ncbi:MAG TPA: hypothetical protein VHG08_07590 [Longimicrobium sp.]|nr:hypothetical protein [Longimicrobium sp.]
MHAPFSNPVAVRTESVSGMARRFRRHRDMAPGPGGVRGGQPADFPLGRTDAAWMVVADALRGGGDTRYRR